MEASVLLRGYPQIIHVNRIFHYKPSILGYLLSGNLHISFCETACLGAKGVPTEWSEQLQLRPCYATRRNVKKWLRPLSNRMTRQHLGTTR